MIALASELYSILPFAPGIKDPVFIVGCGRSGTTILGRALAEHPAITYLNEPRGLWFSCYPETDIWTRKARRRSGRIILTERDVHSVKSAKLSRMLRFATIASRKPILIEKLPINAFRLRFLRAIFPDARFIHIHRNGLEVARSIEKFSETGRWFGRRRSYKWEQLAEIASSRDETADLPGLCESSFDKGLLEWRLSMQAVVDFLATSAGTEPADSWCEISYQELTDHPIETLNLLLSFLGAERNDSVDQFAARVVARQSPKTPPEDLSARQLIIGGSLLVPSLASEQSGLSHSPTILPAPPTASAVKPE